MVDWAPNDEHMSPEPTKSRANHPPQHKIVWDTADTPLDQAWHVLESHLALPKNAMEVQNDHVAQDNIQFHQNSIFGF